MHEVWIAHARGATSLILGYKTTQLQLDHKYTMGMGDAGSKHHTN